MAQRYGWPTIPMERHRCIQAAALALALPATLEKVARALKLEQQKDESGRRTMLQMAMPRPPRQDEDPEGLYWFDDSERLTRLYEYNKQDIAVERAIHHRIGSLSPEEQSLWVLDAAINDRGLFIDGELLDAAIRIAEAAQSAISTELQKITEGALRSINQPKMKEWLGTHGCEVTDIQKTTLQKVLARSNVPPACRRVIELRLDGAHAATAKLRTMRDWRNPDGRARGTLRFHGASTGRWTSFGIQTQNMKRPLVGDIGAAIEAVATGDLDHLRRHYRQPMSVVGDISRALICAPPGHRLITADFSGVESRITAWAIRTAVQARPMEPVRSHARSGRRALFHSRKQELWLAPRTGPRYRQNRRSGFRLHGRRRSLPKTCAARRYLNTRTNKAASASLAQCASRNCSLLERSEPGSNKSRSEARHGDPMQEDCVRMHWRVPVHASAERAQNRLPVSASENQQPRRLRCCIYGQRQRAVGRMPSRTRCIRRDLDRKCGAGNCARFICCGNAQTRKRWLSYCPAHPR